jgi:hypothetical protein
VILPVVPESILPLTLANYPNPEKDQPGEDKDIRQRRVNQMCQKITHFSPFFPCHPSGITGISFCPF